MIRIATDPSYPPFSFLDARGEAVGYDVDLSREVATRLGVRANFVAIEVTTILDALVARKVDAAISGLSPASEYAKSIGFSRSYFNAGQVFVVRRDSRIELDGGGVATTTLGVEVGSTGEVEGRKLAKAKPGLAILPFDTLEAGLSALSSGRVDAAIADRVTAALLLKEQTKLRISGEPFTDEPYVIAVRGSDRTLLKEVDAIIQAMAADGSLNRLERQWIGPES